MNLYINVAPAGGACAYVLISSRKATKPQARRLSLDLPAAPPPRLWSLVALLARKMPSTQKRTVDELLADALELDGVLFGQDFYRRTLPKSMEIVNFS